MEAKITRELGTGKDGKRRYIYHVTISDAYFGPFESPRKARNEAAKELQWKPRPNYIVEKWTHGKVYTVREGRPVLVCQ